MSIKVTSMIWENARELSGTRLLILLAMSDWANDDGGSIYPSLSSIAEKARCGRDHARKTIKDFVREGYLIVEREGGKSGRHTDTTHYRINLARLTSGASAPQTGGPQDGGSTGRGVHRPPDGGSTAPPTGGPQTHGRGVHRPPNPSEENRQKKTVREPLAPTRRERRSEPPADKLVGEGSIRLDIKRAEWHGITEDDLAIWHRAYPAVDIQSELAQAAVWCRVSGARGIRSRYDRFLTNWLKREQDKGGPRIAAGSSQTPPAARKGLGDRWVEDHPETTGEGHDDAQE